MTQIIDDVGDGEKRFEGNRTGTRATIDSIGLRRVRRRPR
jgi:hypothetical protein